MFVCSLLPIETWQTILRYAISIPDFLDPAAFEGALSNFALTDPQCDRNNEAAYWCSERYRNTLQRVCKSWDMYLRSVEHRYVRIVDVWHHKIPTSKMQSGCTLTSLTVNVIPSVTHNCRSIRSGKANIYTGFTGSLLPLSIN